MTKKKPKRSQSRKRRDILIDNVDSIQFSSAQTMQSLTRLKRTDVSTLLKVLRTFSKDDLANDHFPYLFPKAYAELGGTGVPPHTGDVCLERNWLLAVVKTFSADINEFCRLKDDFEHHWLSDHHAEACDVLDSVQSRFGVSLWLLEARFALAQAKGGFTANRELLRAIQNTAGPFIGAIAYYFSLRAEDDVSVYHFSSDLSEFVSAQLELSKSKPPSYVKLVQAYLHFTQVRLDYFGFFAERQEAVCDFAFIASTFSLVDQYLALEGLIQLHLSTRATGSHLPLKELSHTFDDRLFETLTCLQSDSPRIPGRTDDTKLLNELVEHYTCGRYEQAQRLCEVAIASHPESFELYEFLGRSLLAMSTDEYSTCHWSDSAKFVQRLVLDVLKRTQSALESLLLLLKYALVLESSHFAKQAFSFFLLNRAPFHGVSGTRLSSLYASGFTPRLSQEFSDSQSGLIYLEQLRRSGAGEESTQLFEALLTGTIAKGKDSSCGGVPDIRLNKYRALRHEIDSNFEQAAKEYLDIWQSLDAPPYLQSDALSGLYRAYMELSQFHRCADIVVEGALRNQSLLINIRTRQLLEALSDTPPNSLAQRIDRALLYAITAKIDRDIWVTEVVYDLLEDVLLEYGVESPAGLTRCAGMVPDQRLWMFLCQICTPEIMDSWPSFSESGTEGVENERITICEFLLTRMPNMADELVNEIADIRRIQAIRKGIQHIDETKIYIDLNGIKETLDVAFAEKYKRYVKILELPHERLRRQLIASGERDLIIIVPDPNVDDGLKLFIEMFDVVKQRFVASDEFGLDSYVGMQIRHGALGNQLRAIFESRHLVTEEDNDVYESNTYWRQNLAGQHGSNELDALDKRFKAFSAAIDKIIESVKDSWIQITLGDEAPSAIFDYRFTRHELNDYYTTIGAAESLDTFVDALLETLLQRTAGLLQAARDRFENELEPMLSEELNSFEAFVDRTLGTSTHSELERAIVDTRTELTNGVKKVAGWFKLGTEQTFQDFEFANAVEAATEIFSSSFRNCGQTPRLMIDCPSKFAGETFRPFINLFFILIENVFKHATPLRDTVEITAHENSNQLQLRIVNLLPDSTDYASLIETANTINKASSYKEYSRLIRQEEKSGWPKLLKLLSVDLKRTEQSTTITILEEERKFIVEIGMELNGMVV